MSLFRFLLILMYQKLFIRKKFFQEFSKEFNRTLDRRVCEQKKQHFTNKIFGLLK